MTNLAQYRYTKALKRAETALVIYDDVEAYFRIKTQAWNILEQADPILRELRQAEKARRDGGYLKNANTQ